MDAVGVGGQFAGVGIVLVGMVVVAVALGVFLVGDRYRGSEILLSPVERSLLCGEVDLVLREVAPGALALEDRERELGGISESGKLWRRFAEVSVLVEEDPAAALSAAWDLPGLLAEAERVVERGLEEKHL